MKSPKKFTAQPARFRWRVVPNPAPDRWPGTWVAWEEPGRGIEGQANEECLHAYLGQDRADLIRLALAAGVKEAQME